MFLIELGMNPRFTTRDNVGILLSTSEKLCEVNSENSKIADMRLLHAFAVACCAEQFKAGTDDELLKFTLNLVSNGTSNVCRMPRTL